MVPLNDIEFLIITMMYYCRKELIKVKKIGPYGPQLIWHFSTQLAKSTQLSLHGPHIKAHEV